MTESGARRVKHAIHFDVESVRFPDDALLVQLRNDVDGALAEVAPGDTGRLTNLGLYRLYLKGYFRDHRAVRQDMPIVVRHVQSTQPVVALEIFIYVDETRWEPYENLQSDMLDHAYGQIPQFGLRCWQEQTPSRHKGILRDVQ